MLWNYDVGGSWLWMGSSMVFFWSGVVLLAIWAIRALTRSKQTNNSAMDTLRRRRAEGEMTPQEFEKTKKGAGVEL